MKLITYFTRYPKTTTAALCLVAVGAFAMTSSHGTSISSSKLMVERVTLGDLDIYAEGFGHFVALDNSTVTAPFNGVIDSIQKRSGDHVTQGDTLLTLINRDVMSALMSEKNKLANASLELIRLEQESAAEIEDQIATIETEKTKLALSELTLNAKEKLATTGVVSGLEIAEAKMRFELARQTLKAQSNKLKQLRQRAKQSAKLQQQKIALAQSIFDERKKDVDALTIKAPNSGVLAELDAQTGDAATFGQKLGQIKGNKNYAVLAQFPQHVATKVTPDLKVKISFLGQQINGTIVRVLPGVTNGFIQTEVLLTTTSAEIVEDLEVEVQANISTHHQVMYAKKPDGMIKGESVSVFKVKGNKAVKTSITVEKFEGAYMIIAEHSLQDGDQIIVSNTNAYSNKLEIQIQ